MFVCCFDLQTFAKWLSFLHFMYCLPSAGQAPSLMEYEPPHRSPSLCVVAGFGSPVYSSVWNLFVFGSSAYSVYSVVVEVLPPTISLSWACARL